MPDITSVTLCAGSSSRMPPRYRPKALCRVGGEPVLTRLLRLYGAARTSQNVVVFAPSAADAYRNAVTLPARWMAQTSPHGTGDAASCGLVALGGDAPERVLICMGDKVFASGLLPALLAGYRASGDDLWLTAGKTTDFRGAGRIVEQRGRIVASIEACEVRRSWASQYVQWKGPYRGFDVPGLRATPDEIDAAEWSNLSVYVGRTAVIRKALALVGTNNTKEEKYLTDIVQIIAGQGGRVGMYQIEKPEDCMGFNTVSELQLVRKVYGGRSCRKSLR